MILNTSEGVPNQFLVSEVVDGLTAHAGGTKAAALQLTKEGARVTTVATAGDSVLLPLANVGIPLIPFTLINAGANAMQVFGNGTDTINGIATATGISQPANTVGYYFCPANGAWVVFFIGLVGALALPLRSVTNGITAFSGGGQASATALISSINRVTVVAVAGDSVKLPVAVPGMNIVVINADSADSMDVFPATGGVINALAANAQLAVAANKTVEFYCAVAGTWNSILTA